MVANPALATRWAVASTAIPVREGRGGGALGDRELSGPFSLGVNPFEARYSGLDQEVR
jgi:hypothetical protein